MEEVQKMIDLSVYVSGGKSALEELQKALAVKKSNCYNADDNDVDYSFFVRKENAFQLNKVNGEFQFMIDMYVFGVSMSDLNDIFVENSKLGYVFAIPDEETDNPFGFIVYKNGKKEKRYINEISEDNIEKLVISKKY